MDHDFPFVTHGRTEFATPHASHDFHSEAFVQMAVERISQKGSKRVVLVAGHDTTYNDHTIITGFEHTAARLGLDPTVA